MFRHSFLGRNGNELYVVNSEGATLVQSSQLEDLAVALVQHHNTRGGGTLGIYCGNPPSNSPFLRLSPFSDEEMKTFFRVVDDIYHY
ncbi:MAG: hypothetical protein AABX72_04820 [Nanoarchaeota archaeon]